MIGRLLVATLLLVGVLGPVGAEEDPRTPEMPGALTDALQELAIELARVELGPSAPSPEPPYGVLALATDGRLRRTFVRATEAGRQEEVDELTWGEDGGLALLRGVRDSTRAFSRQVGLELWTGETGLTVVVAADRRVPWYRVTRLLGALAAAGVRRFLLTASPGGEAPAAPVLLVLDLPRRTEPYGAHGRSVERLSVQIVTAHGASQSEVLHRVEVGGGPTLLMGEDVLEATRSLAGRLDAFMSARAPAGDAAQLPWRVGDLATEPSPCAAVRCEHALPIAAALLRVGLDQVNLDLEDPRRCLRPLSEPHASFDAYEAMLVERQAKEEPRERFVRAQDWLIAHQEDDGSWRHTAPSGVRQDLVVTSLALLCFSEDGWAEWGRGPLYEAVHRGLRWLRDQQGKDGVFRVEGGPAGDDARLGHALASLAVVDAWALRPDPAKRAGVAAALAALDAQSRTEGEIHAADVVALLARFHARRTNEWLGARAEPLPWGTRPSVQVPDPRPAGWEKDAATSEIQYEVLRRMLVHSSREEQEKDSELRRLGKALADRTPVWTQDGRGVDVLSWWLTSAILFEQGGLPWKVWNSALGEIVLRQDRQRRAAESADLAGSWDPVGVGAAQIGRTGATASMGLVKGVFYRYD